MKFTAILLKAPLIMTLCFLAACNASEQAPKTTDGQSRNRAMIPEELPTPILASRNWSAQIIEKDGQRTLLVEGEVDLPTPGYKVSSKAGPMDRMMPPGLRIPLTLTKPNGMVIQVVTATPIQIEIDSKVPANREIIVQLDGETIAKIPNVTTR